MRRILVIFLLSDGILAQNPPSFEKGRAFANSKISESETGIKEGGIVINGRKIQREIPREGEEHGIFIARTKGGAANVAVEQYMEKEKGQDGSIYKHITEMRNHPERGIFIIDEDTDPVLTRSETIGENPLKSLNEVENITPDQNGTTEECEECSNEEYTITTHAEKRFLQKITASQYCRNHGLLTVEVELESAPEDLFREAVTVGEIRLISSVQNGAYIFETYDVRGKQLVLRKTIMQNGSPWINPGCYLVPALTQNVVNGPALALRLLSGSPEAINWGDIQNVSFNVDENRYFFIGDALSHHVEELEEQGLADIENVIEATPTTKRWPNKAITDSWNRTISYKCRHQCDGDTCKMLRARGCEQIGTVGCLRKAANGQCIKYKQRYRCRDRVIKGKTILGDRNAFCLDGNCLDANYESDRDMLQALGALSVAKEIAHVGKDGTNNIHIFNGAERGCNKGLWGENNCCTMKAWLRPRCNREEEDLKKNRAEGKCVKVGWKCIEKIPIVGECMRKREVYCCYDSKFTRVVQEQGRRQISKGFGTADCPDCGGFTPDELDGINFEIMDFSEVTQEIMAKFQPPKIDEHYAEGMELEKIREQMKIPTGSGTYLQENMKHLTKIKAKK
jgi:conjugal transfer mating pair stabilization protein TraN